MGDEDVRCGEMGEAVAGGAEAEIDLFAVAGFEARPGKLAAWAERRREAGPGNVRAEAHAREHRH